MIDTPKLLAFLAICQAEGLHGEEVLEALRDFVADEPKPIPGTLDIMEIRGINSQRSHDAYVNWLREGD